MIPIKHILQENGVQEIFKLIVPNGNFQGDYVIKKPNGWDSFKSIVNIDNELLHVKDFIIGDSSKLSFGQYNDKIAFDVVDGVYNEQKGDGRIIFKWIALKNDIEYELLKDPFEINLNKYSKTFDKSMFKIDIELIKSEEQKKLLNREDTTVDLFAEKDLDEKNITPVETFQIGYKKGDKTLSNFYTYDLDQSRFPWSARKDHFFSFLRAEGYEFGNNKNDYAGFKDLFNHYDQGPFVYTDITLKKIEIEITNMLVKFRNAPTVHLCAIIRGNSAPDIVTVLKSSTVKTVNGETFSEINIGNELFKIPAPNETMKPGQSLFFNLFSDTDFIYEVMKDTMSIEITTNLESPLVKTRGVRIVNAIDQIVKNYTSSQLSVLSNFIGPGGIYYDTSISTGVYLRGLPDIYTAGQKMKTSLKSLLNDGTAKLLTLGYDILGKNVIVEDYRYFFKDIQSYDISDKVYLQEGYKVDNDKDITFNSLVFGSKKYSTKVKDDIKNFITTAEFSTPIISTKNKFDKQTDIIIDEYKIQELIEDNTSSTNDNDDDLVLIDMVNQVDYWDTGVFDNCIHWIKNGRLALTCTSIPFDTTMIDIGAEIQITEGLNAGTWIVLEKSISEILLSKSSGIQEGTADTPIRYLISSLIKNRSINDGFADPENIRNPETSTNTRHNPKYHMARWFPFFGSGLRKKSDSDLIKVTNYKNNSIAKMKAISSDLSNELPGTIEVGANEELSRLRQYSQPLFYGDIIEINLQNVKFDEFINLYESWRYGKDGNRMESRGYITVNTPMGIYDIYPFGDEAFSHDRMTNVLGIKGKIKSKSIINPDLLSVTQIDKTTVTIKWEYSPGFINPTIDIQFSKDGVNWITVNRVINVKEFTFSYDELNTVITGETVYFRVIVSTQEYGNKRSNSLPVLWKFNDWIIIENSRDESTVCGYSRLSIDIKGKADLNIEYLFESAPSGGSLSAYNTVGNANDVMIETPNGWESWIESKNNTMTVNHETKRLFIQIWSGNETNEGFPLNCTSGNNSILAKALLKITFTDTISNDVKIIYLKSVDRKYYSI